MTAFEAYQLFNSLKLHFMSETYDFFKYNGKIKTTEHGFEMRKDKWFYYKLAKRSDIKKFILSNFVDGDPAKWIGNIIGNAEVEEIYNKWLKRQQSLSYVVLSEMKQLHGNNPERYNNFFKVSNGQHPSMLKWLLTGLFCYETIIILNDLSNFFEYWNRKIDDKVVWPAIEKKCRKYKPFLEYDKIKMKKIIKDRLTEEV